MFAKGILLCLVVSIWKVSANPLMQAIPTQNCPVCPQNARNQYSLPQLLQQAPSNIQPYLQSILGQNGMYQPASHSLNQCSQCQPQNGPINANLFNKIMSNPTLRTIMDPNTRLYNQNGCEIPRNGPCGNAVPNVVNNYIIVPPEFILEDAKCVKDDRDVRARDRSPDNVRKRQRIESGERHKVKDKSGDGKRVKERDDNVNIYKDGKSGNETEKRKERTSKRRGNKNTEVKVKVLNENVSEPNQIEQPVPIIPENSGNVEHRQANHSTVNDNKLEETTTSTPLLETNKTSNEPNLTTEQPKQATTIVANSESKLAQSAPIKSVRKNEHSNKDQPKRKTDNRQRSSRIRVNNNNNAVKNSREEAAIQDFRQKFPNIPEEVVRNLLDHMKRQIEKQQLGVPAFYYPHYPISYEQLYKPQTSKPALSTSTQRPNNTTKKPRSGRRKGRRRNQRKGRKQANKQAEDFQTVVELTPSVIVEEPITTETTLLIETTTKEAEIMTTTDAEIGNIETTTVKHCEQENVDIKEDYSDEKIDDIETYYYPEYYPDFTNDNQYLANDEDYTIKFLQDDRYHYTTDKNYEFEELNRERRKYDPKFLNENEVKRLHNRYIFRLNNQDVRRRNKVPFRPRLIDSTTENPKLKVTIVNEEVTIPSAVKPRPEPRTIIEEAEDLEITTEAIAPTTQKEPLIEFRTPPTLETIDFETKPVDREKFYSYSDFSDKVSSYSDVKTPQYSMKEKGDRMKVKTKPKDEIETVFARSKVVTYGRPSSEEMDERDKSSLIEKDDDISHYYADDRTIVLAKSLGHDDYW